MSLSPQLIELGNRFRLMTAEQRAATLAAMTEQQRQALVQAIQAQPLPAATIGATCVLTPRQQEAEALLNSAATHRILFGGSRSGKTFIVCREIAKRALLAPGSRHAILRFRFSHLHTSIIEDTWPKMMGLCFPHAGGKLDRQLWVYRFENGSEVWYGGLDEKERTEKTRLAEIKQIRRTNPNAYWRDEALQAEELRLIELGLQGAKVDAEPEAGETASDDASDDPAVAVATELENLEALEAEGTQLTREQRARRDELHAMQEQMAREVIGDDADEIAEYEGTVGSLRAARDNWMAVAGGTLLQLNKADQIDLAEKWGELSNGAMRTFRRFMAMPSDSSERGAQQRIATALGTMAPKDREAAQKFIDGMNDKQRAAMMRGLAGG